MKLPTSKTYFTGKYTVYSEEKYELPRVSITPGNGNPAAKKTLYPRFAPVVNFIFF